MSDANLSHWDFSEDFSGFEVAALILGVDPHSMNEAEDKRINLVFSRISKDYTNIILSIAEKHANGEVFEADLSAYEKSIAGIALHVIFPGLYSGDLQLSELSQKERDIFNKQTSEILKEMGITAKFNSISFYREKIENHVKVTRFNRSAIVHWLRTNNLRSVYEFDLAGRFPSTGISASQSNSHWPWGAHSTKLLEHLEAAAKHFWVNHDPGDPSTAPTNSQVIEWLEQRGVSNSLAKAMATILRQDGLPTGPRR